MRIGFTYDLKSDGLANGKPASGPDDLLEEFDSPVTIQAIAEVLRDLGHEVVLLGDGPNLLKKLLAEPPDFVFNMAEGEGVGRAREARVPAVLEMLGIPYTGSDPLTLAVSLDKVCTKRLIQTTKLKTTPRGVVVQADQNPQEVLGTIGFPFPVIVKPAWEGSSKGIRTKCLVDEAEQLPQVVKELREAYEQPILVEEFIHGDELTVGVIGNKPPHILGVMRVVPKQAAKRFIYSLEVKRDYLRQVRYECPPPYSPDLLARIEGAALEVYQELGCRDVARVDFRLCKNELYFLEVNPLPGLNPESSDLVIMAGLAGWTYERLIATIVEAACERQSSAGVPARHPALTS